MSDSNGGILNPDEGILMISANVEDITVQREDDGRVVIAVENFREGIEIVHDRNELWWPV